MHASPISVPPVACSHWCVGPVLVHMDASLDTFSCALAGERTEKTLIQSCFELSWAHASKEKHN